MARSLTRPQPACECPPDGPIASFYREEFLKHLEFLRLQRGYFSESAVASAEEALDRILAQLDALCARQNVDELVSRLLASFDCVTGVSWQRDGTTRH
jgi:hypothetical protein